ncbi:uncharacterized protein LOC124300663 isoform X1 [Neodiprion virginianus]|uniref:uncharacterized protein LOC124300663 isoform X1 n=1 Tax=Neodiprion virginianus TaxID=2961670 RepID=UPI001EE74F1F|nr:uncharacterized protein LOC124300663 isoform X1 [Neodiprion virginianus]XP_046610932.1 uncharacterized protein LOC124300663 isoform X1 [Neodiprion virginianus]
MAFRLSVSVVLTVVALLVSGQDATLRDSKASIESSVKIPKSISYQDKLEQNVIHNDQYFANHRAEETPSPEDSLDGASDHNESDFHSLPWKPSKFDRDVSDLILTDVKSLHESEATRLGAERQKEKSNIMEKSELGGAETIGLSDDLRNSLRRTDSYLGKEETTVQDKSDKNNQRCNKTLSIACLEADFGHLIEKMSNFEVYNVTDFIQIVRNPRSVETSDVRGNENSVVDKVSRYARQHVLKFKMPSDVSLARASRTFFGAFFQEKSSFLTGFGLGFLAFGLKKLMMPLFIGMQIVKSVLIAMFLPSIIGAIGKFVGKGVSTFSQVSQTPTNQPEESFEFKDNADIYNADYMNNQPIGTLPASAMYSHPSVLQSETQYMGIPGANQRISYGNALSDNYYSRNSMQGTTKRQDYKVFHEIPTSSLLLTNYDPFYSPLLSRLDAVFSRLGHSTEPCREYAICAMYRSPARYAPYSNLVSAQLSKELNELRKPTSDNPDVLRFFKYMKAAKDGQDGIVCEEVYTECASRGSSSGQNQAMLATYQDINKLVQARKI